MRASDYEFFDPPFAAMAHRGGSLMADNFARENTLHSVVDDTGVFFRGNQNLRLSADYLTGACGVLAALREVLDSERSLPFGL